MRDRLIDVCRRLRVPSLDLFHPRFHSFSTIHEYLEQLLNKYTYIFSMYDEKIDISIIFFE